MDTSLEQTQKEKASNWFRQLRDDICTAFETLEQECESPFSKDKEAGKFVITPWDRTDNVTGQPGGGGEMGLMRGRLFEKVGVNISTVEGKFSENFRISIPGTDESDGDFWASGISLVAHFSSPHIPPIHFNTRHIRTSKAWFGGGGDLNPAIEYEEDTRDFHGAWKECCDRHDPEYYTKFSRWADEYFYIKHRNKPRGIGGIFYDYLKNDWDKDFDFTQDVGRTFLDTVPKIIRRHMNRDWTEQERDILLVERGHYAEFNLVYDRGTLFGLQTGGKTEAILMSLPPVAKWP